MTPVKIAYRLSAVLAFVVAVGMMGFLAAPAIEHAKETQRALNEYKMALAASNEIATKIESLTGAFATSCSRLKSPNDIYVDLRKVKSADAALQAIARYPQIGWGRFSETNLTDAGMNYVSAFSGLQILDVSGTRITDAGVKNLEGLTHIRTLVLDRTQVTDAGLKYLQNLRELKYLSLFKTPITDDGLKSLKKLSQLEELIVDGTKVTDAGVADLQKALPMGDITH